MKTRKRSSRILGLAALAASLVAMVAILDSGAGRVSAFNPQPDPPAFGLVSLNPGQTLRLNVVFNRQVGAGSSEGSRMRNAILAFDSYEADQPGSAPLSSEVNPGPCVTTHPFNNRQSCQVALAPGEAASLDLAVSSAFSFMRVLPTVQDDDRNHRDLIYTVEVRENGKTMYLVPAVLRSLPN